MGLFSSKKKTYVSSVTYPLGDDGEKRTDFLKYTVLNATLQNRPVAESITRGYLGGLGMSLRNAFGYARDQYAAGVPQSSMAYLDSPDTSLLVQELQAQHEGHAIKLVGTYIGTADFEWFAERFLAEEYGYDRILKQFNQPPEGVEANAALAYDLERSNTIRILAMNADGSTRVLTYMPTDFVAMQTYVHSVYRTQRVFDSGPEKTVREPLPGETDSITTTFEVVDRSDERQERTTTVDVTIVAGETGPEAHVTTQLVVVVTSRPKYFIYRAGSGTYPSLDQWLLKQPLNSPYYPAVPLRVNNEDWTKESKQGTRQYKTSKKLLGRLGIKIDDIAKSLNDNESIKDIDYAFIAFGVSLNTKSQEGKRYIYRFMEMLRANTSASTTKSSYTSWYDGHVKQAETSQQSMMMMAAAAAVESTETDGGYWGNWNTETGTSGGTPSSGYVTPLPPKVNELSIHHTKDRDKNHDIKLQWDYIDTTIKAGQIFPGAKPGDADVSMSGTRTEINFWVIDTVLDNSKLYVRRQIDADSYEEMEIAGLVYENFVYKGKSVIISAYDAFHDPDEEGFILPLSQQIVRQTPLVELTDLSYQVCHLVLNCYKVVKQKWYQRGIFKVLLVIVAIVVTVLVMIYAPAAAPGITTSIATALSGGAALTMTAIIAAASITVLGGMVLMQVLSNAATELFGEEWGAVIAVVASFVAMNWSNLGTIFSNIANGVATAAQVMQVTTLVANAYGAWTAGQMSEIQKKALGLETEFDKQMKEIEELTKANLGTNLDMIDIQGYTAASFIDLFELPGTFLSRTLMTGSQIVEITNGLVENFADIGLQLPNHG